MLPEQDGALEIFLNSLVIAFKSHSKVVPVHAMKACVGVEVLLHSDLGTRQDEWQFFTWIDCPWEKRSTVPIEWKTGWLQSWFGFFGEEKNFFPLPGIKPQLLAVLPPSYLLQQPCYPYSYSRS
jgi:hypothetical protein